MRTATVCPAASLTLMNGHVHSDEYLYIESFTEQLV